jgi:hypothetical protein
MGLKESGIKYGWEELEGTSHEHESKDKKTIVGKLSDTGRMVKPVRYSTRKIYVDEAGQEWVKIRGMHWRFPQEIEY